MAANHLHERIRGAAGSPWLVGLLAVLELILGFVLLSFPFLLGASAVWVGGFVLLAVGIMRIIQVFVRSYDRWWSLFAGLVYLVLGVCMIYFTAQSLALLTLLVGIALLVGGVLRLGVAIGMHRQPGSAWRFFNAIVSIILGAMVVWSWPASSVWLLGTIISIEMIFSGWTLLFLALAPQPALSAR